MSTESSANSSSKFPSPHADPSTAPILTAFEDIYRKFDKHFFENALSKKAVVTLSHKGTRATSNLCGTEKVWEDGRREMFYEVNICPEELSKPMESICGTMLHQMVHLSNALNGIADCSRDAQYHNKKYKESAEKHGLKVEMSRSNGYSETSLNPKALAFVETLNLTAFDLFRHGKSETGNESEAPAKTSSSRTYKCPSCENTFRATKDLNVRCEDCDESFVKQEK